jgi:hypothetical protein
MIFNVTMEEANIIGSALGKMPYEVVARLVSSLSRQVAEQQEVEKPPVEKPPVEKTDAAKQQVSPE